MNNQNVLTFDECCFAVLSLCKDGYAKAYADAGIGMTDSDAVRVQSLYILANVTRWRGETAKAVRASLKQYANAKG